MIIVGIDPGTLFTGFGVIENVQQRWIYRDHGVIAMPQSYALPAKLDYLFKNLSPLWHKWPVAITVIERVFLGKNVESAFKLGHARGVCMMIAAANGSQVVEYSPRTVKKNITGSGAADKMQMQIMVEQILGRKIADRHDATDALALAICHGWQVDRGVTLQQLEVL